MMSHILKEFQSLSYRRQVDILFNAIDYMQQYNGRSRSYCICLAMDYEFIEDENMWIKY